MFTRTPKDLDRELLDSLRNRQIIGIHGANGSGKSHLAKELISLIGGTHIRVDDYLEPRKGAKYLDLVKFEEISTAFKNAKAPVIFDCFVLLDVLEKLNLKADEILLCERRNCTEAYFNKDLESTFTSYEKRRALHEGARYVFQLNWPF